MTKKGIAKEVAQWLITLFVALVCLRSGLTKLTGNSFWVKDFTRWGYPHWFQSVVGVAELLSCVLLLIPRVASYGALIFAIVMLGAILTHSTHHEMERLPFNFVLLALSLIVLFARNPTSLLHLRK